MSTWNAEKLDQFVNAVGIEVPPIGVYDVLDPEPFAPFVEPSVCIFAGFNGWLEGRSTVVNSETAAEFQCPGAGYYMCGISSAPRDDVAHYLGEVEGLKSSPAVMKEWLEKNPTRSPENGNIVISQLRAEHAEDLRTVTFFIEADQLSLFVAGAEYLNDSAESRIETRYGSGCGYLLSLFGGLDRPKALISSTDVAMRKHLPRNLLSVTVNIPMFEQLINLDERSFLHKSFWRELREARAQTV